MTRKDGLLLNRSKTDLDQSTSLWHCSAARYSKGYFIHFLFLSIIDLYPTVSQSLPLIAMQLDCRHKYISLALAGRQFVTEEKRSYRLWCLC